jgi:hypothetical protein
MADFVTYQQVVEQFRTACNEHLAINQFGEGSIDRLDSLYQNALYPYAFLRPIQSTGMITSQNGVSGARSLNFEFYMIDVPLLTDTDVLQIQSQCEIYLYDIISYFNLGAVQQVEFVTLNSISPLYEAFNDRVAGWMCNITVTTTGVLNFCNFPKL